MKELSKLGVFALLLTSSLTIMVGTVIAPSLNEISKHLGFENNPGWLITLPSLGVVLFAPLMGKLIDKKGPYRIICWGLIPYALLGVLGAVLNNVYVVIADRILLGAATAAVQSSGSSLIAEFFHGDKRMKMMAWQGMAIEIGGVVFLSAGGVLGEMGWRFPFLLYLTGMICVILIVLYIPRINPPVEKKSEEPKESYISDKIGSIISSEMLIICLSSMFAMILFFVAFVGLPQYLPKRFNYSASHTGYFMAFISMIAVIFASQMPKVVKRLGAKSTVSLGFFLFALGLSLFSMAYGDATLLLSAIAIGAGFGFTVPLLNHMTIEHSDVTNRGRNLSYYSIGIFGGQFLSSFVGMISPNIQTVFSISSALALIISAVLFFRAEQSTSEG